MALTCQSNLAVIVINIILMATNCIRILFRIHCISRCTILSTIAPRVRHPEQSGHCHFITIEWQSMATNCYNCNLIAMWCQVLAITLPLITRSHNEWPFIGRSWLLIAIKLPWVTIQMHLHGHSYSHSVLERNTMRRSEEDHVPLGQVTMYHSFSPWCAMRVDVEEAATRSQGH